MANKMPSLFAWVIENLQESNNSEYVDLIKKKYEIEVTNSANGNVIKKNQLNMVT